MHTVIITLHRKVDNRNECICGSPMRTWNQQRVCEIAFQKRQPNQLVKKYTDKEIKELIKSGNEY